MKKSGKGKRGKSKSRSGSRSGRPGGKGSDHGGKAGKGHALDASYDSGADLLSEASAATDSEEPAKLVPRHRGPAFPAHPIGQADKAYFEASMSVEVLGGEISDIVDPKEIPRVAHTKVHAPRRGRGRHGRPVSAPAGRRPTTGRVAEGGGRRRRRRGCVHQILQGPRCCQGTSTSLTPSTWFQGFDRLRSDKCFARACHRHT